MRVLNLKKNKKEIEELFIKAIKHQDCSRIGRVYWKGKINRVMRLFDTKIISPLSLNFYPHCRFCSNPSLDNLVITRGYWTATWSVCHEACKKAGEKLEVFECQKIDSDCNDCFYFQRVKGSSGNCQKFNKKVKALPNFCSGYKCFKHRLDK